MPPKRKAAGAASTEAAVPQTRRRTRSTAATTTDEPVELPPAKRTRRRTKTEEEPAPNSARKEDEEETQAPTKGSSRATRAAARGRKTEPEDSDAPNKPEPRATRRTGRAKKSEQEDMDSNQPEEPDAPKPPSPPIVPKKRGRAAKASIVDEPAPDSEPEPEPVEATESSRPKRVRAAKAAVDPPQVKVTAKSSKKLARVDEVEDPQPEEAPAPKPPSPPPEKPAPRKRGRPAKLSEAAPPEDSRPKRARRTKQTDASQDEVSSTRVPSSAADNDSEAPAPDEPTQSAPKTRGRRKVAPVVPPKPPPPRQVSPVKRALTPPMPDASESDSDDELLLTSGPPKKRPATPARNGAGRVGTPRMVLHSVEIAVTPRHTRNTTKRDLGSPTPRASAHIPPAGTPRLPAAFPTISGSPSKRSQAAPQPPVGKRRVARTPSPPPLSAPVSPTRTPRRGAASSPAKGKAKQVANGLPRVLPEHLHPLLDRQKRATLKSLQNPPEIDEIEVYGEDYPPTNTAAYEQLSDLLTGSVVRGEGNSCLLIGPSGSGKTQMVERAIAVLPSNPIVVRLSGYAQHNDRLAIREIAWQLAQQTGTSFLPSDPDEDDEDDAGKPAESAPALAPKEQTEAIEQEPGDGDDEDENPFIEGAPVRAAEPVIALPPPAQLLALISMIPTLPRPTIVVLDGFDLFAGHARQALLYCLLDTAQSCRAGTVSGTGSGMAVVGVTARVDTINLLEKRVKSRFSGRMIRTACPAKIGHWVELAKGVLGADVEGDEEEVEEWKAIWSKAVERFVGDEEVVEVLRETYALTRDFQMFRRIMTCLTLGLTPASPYPTRALLESAVSRQRCPPRYPPLHTLPYPAVCLLIASVHAQTSGHDVFTFEMLYDTFKSQLRTSQSAPVQIEGGGIGMVRCSREVLFSAFERLVDLHVFMPAAAPSASIGKVFALHRSTVDRFAVRKAVDTIGQLNLKKWLTKA